MIKANDEGFVGIPQITYYIMRCEGKNVIW